MSRDNACTDSPLNFWWARKYFQEDFPLTWGYSCWRFYGLSPLKHDGMGSPRAYFAPIPPILFCKALAFPSISLTSLSSCYLRSSSIFFRLSAYSCLKAASWIYCLLAAICCELMTGILLSIALISSFRCCASSFLAWAILTILSFSAKYFSF